MSRLLAVASTLLGLLLLAGVGWLAWSWYESRLPGSYDAMDYATPDYGGGPHDRALARRLDQLLGPRGPAPDFRKTITAQKADVRLSSGKVVHALTFDGRVPGPELHVLQGDLVEVTLVNEDIAEGVSIHWHGVDVPNREDGVAGVTQNAVMPGERYTYRFRAEQVGTFWYHSHQDAADEVRRGLYGAFVIEPREPSPVPSLDLTAVVHTFPDGVVIGSNDETDRHVVLPRTGVRLRLINTDSSAQRLTLAGTPFKVIAIDGTDLNDPTPVSGKSILLGAGARYDLAFNMPTGPVEVNVVGSIAAILFNPGKVIATEDRAEPGPTFDPAGYGSAAPTPFSAKSRFDRSFEVDIGRKFGFLDGKPGSHWSVNDKLYPHTPMFMVSVGDLVKMTIRNDSGATHPMHLHGHHFLVLTRNGERLTGSPWWVDTLNVQPHETYGVGFTASNPGVWMFHCHNLPHARDGLTMHVVYGGVMTPYRIGGAAHNHPE
ncbi:MAG: multicopper oxidase family protein [Actinomycetota bacterium]